MWRSVGKNAISEAYGDESSGPFQQTVPVVLYLNYQTATHVS